MDTPKIPKPIFDESKFRELMLYAAQQSQTDEHFGATKLNKILFFSDFLSYALAGQAITGATYIRQQRGPVPKQLKPMERKIETEQDGYFISRRYFNLKQRRLVPKREANTRRFSHEELDLINDVIKMLSSETASGASELSHQRSFAWQVASMGEEIPYTAAFLSSRRATSADIERGRELAAKYGW